MVYALRIYRVREGFMRLLRLFLREAVHRVTGFPRRDLKRFCTGNIISRSSENPRDVRGTETAPGLLARTASISFCIDVIRSNQRPVPVPSQAWYDLLSKCNTRNEEKWN